MDELRDILRRALPAHPPAFDMAAIRARSTALRRRRNVGVLALVAVTALSGAYGMQAASNSDGLRVAGPNETPAAGSSPEPSAGATSGLATIRLAFGNCDDFMIVEREVAAADADPVGVVRQLLDGPAPGEPRGRLFALLGPGAGGAVRSVHFGDHAGYVDLSGAYRDRLLAGTEECHGSRSFVEEISQTLRIQFPPTAAVYYAFDGDPRSFVESMGETCPAPPVRGGPCDKAPFTSGDPRP
jgi:hypothetical protein